MSIVINGIEYDSTLHDKESWKFGINHINTRDQRKMYEPQRSTDFEFVITDLEGLINPVTLQEIDPAVAQEGLRLSVIQCPIPHFQVNALEERRGNSVMKFAGVPTYQSGQITVRDWIGVASKDILMAWQNQVYDVTSDKVGLMSDYKRDAYLIEYTPSKQPIRVWQLYGVWPSGISENSFDNSSASDRQISCTLEFDYAKLLPGSDFISGESVLT